MDGESEPGADDLPREERDGRCEEEAEDEADLRHGERVRLLPEVDVDGQRLGDVEGDVRSPTTAATRRRARGRGVRPSRQTSPAVAAIAVVRSQTEAGPRS